MFKGSNGETGIIDGVEYTKRTREQITVENAATTCTSNRANELNRFTIKKVLMGYNSLGCKFSTEMERDVRFCKKL